MPSEIRYQNIAQLRPQVGVLSLFISLISFSVLVASIFSFPFPLVRPFWIREALGLTGIVNGIFLLLLASQIEKMSLPAAVGGLGLILNDQILVWKGFFVLLSRHESSKHSLLFLGGAAVMELFLLLLFVSSARLIWTHHAAKRQMAVSDPTASLINEEPAGFSPLILSGIVYAGFFLSIYWSLSLTPKYSFTVLKAVAQLASLASFLGVGVEMDYYVKGRQGKWLCGVKAISHWLMLAVILCVAYRLMPIEKMIF